MFGIVIKKEINKMGFPYAIIKGANGITYYCDDRGMENGKVENLVVGESVEYVSFKDNKGKIIATHLKRSKKPVSQKTSVKKTEQIALEVEEKERIKRIIVSHIKETGSIFLTSLNVFLLGKNIDYHTYGYKKPKDFFKENFSDVLCFDEEEINGCPQTKISLKAIIEPENSTEVSTDSETEGTILRQKAPSMYEEFKQLVEDEDYEGILQSRLINSISPDKLSLRYMEKAIWAAQKLIGIDDELYLSEFDKKIISAPISSSLFIMKKDEAFMKAGQEECFEKCSAKVFQKHFNALNETNTHNTTYLAIALRFQTVYNRLYLPFYVLAAFTSRKITVADEFLKFTQNNSIFDSFIAFNKILSKTVFLGQEFNQSYITRVLSISLDSDRFDLFADFCSEILGGVPAFVRWIDEEELQYDNIVEMLSPNSFFKEKVVEKYINFYMYKKLNDGKLSGELIHLLSEIAYSHPISYVEEILTNNSYVGFSRIYKRDLLLNNFKNIIEYMKNNSKAYVLACFVINHFMGDDVSLTEEFSAIARTLTSEQLSKIKSNPQSLYEIYPLFKLDASGRSLIEEAYCDYMDTAFPQCMSAEESKTIIHDYNSNNCSFATVYYIENRENKDELLLDSTISVEYLTALKSNTNYAKAIRYVKSCKDSPDSKAREIIKILYMNFKEYGVSSKAYDIFDDDFTIDLAEALALDNFMPTNGTPIVLMGIYKKKNDLIRVLYLYAIYYHLTKTGNRTFYAQLHKSDARISSMDSHYKAIRMAFTKYTYNDLIAFLDWASRIIIDGRYTSRFEICKTEIDRLIKNPQAKQNWEAIISKLAKDNIRQINSAFGYVIQCVYLLKFYNLDEESDRQVAEASIDQLTRFASFSKISETTNFISLNIKMIDVMPETYVIKFAEFFERNSSIFVENTEVDDCEIEKLYVLLLNKYNEGFGEEYLNIAIAIYDVFSSRLSPHLELYKDFCRSSKEKTVLFKMLFKLYSPENALSFHEFIYNNEWNCTDEEFLVLDVLRIVYSLENDELPKSIARLSSRLLQSFKCDVAMMLQEYPSLTKYNTLMAKDESLAYKYLVLQYVMRIAFDQNVYWDTSDKYWDVCDQRGIWNDLKNDYIDGIDSALSFFKISYAKQCKYVQSLGIEYITRRYINLYLIDLYSALADDIDITDVSDEYIVELMRENNHISLIYDKDYKKAKNLLCELCSSNISAETLKALLLSVIRGSLCPLVGNEQAFNAIMLDADSLEKMKLLFKMTGYPSLAQSALYLYFNNTKSERIASFCKLTLPSTYDAIVAYNELSGKEDKNLMREFINYAYTEMNHKQFLLSVIGNKFGYFDEANYDKYKYVIIHVIIATVFNYNILRDFGNVVRQGKITTLNAFFKDLMVQMNEESVYWYLCAIQYALGNKRDEATAAFYRVGGKSHVPDLWETEFDNLDKYIRGETSKFKTIGIYNDFSAQKETVIGATILIDIATNSVNEDATLVNARSAMEVFANDSSTSQEKLNAGAIVLAFVKDDAIQFIQNVSRTPNNASEEKITYNELIFEYGLLVIKSRKTLLNKKVDVLFELFQYFELLNDKNRRKFEENLKNAFVNLFATAKSQDDVIAYEQWIGRNNIIKETVEKHNLQLEGYDFFLDLLEKCVCFENGSYTIMEKIRFLESLPNGISVKPVTRNFLSSVKKELERLRKGVVADIVTINREIEDDSVFILIKNVPQSCVSIDLSPHTGTSKFIVTTFNNRSRETSSFEGFCSGNIDNIRPGQISGERITIPKYLTQTWADGDLIDITIVFDFKSIMVCNNVDQGTKFTYRNEPTKTGIESPQHKYITSSCAFTEDNKGFGRTSDKEWLDKNIPTKGLSVVYGPSRVGKSSLLKYIRNYLAVDYKHHQGVFASTDKKVDVLYVVSHKENYYKLPEKEEDRLLFLFLEPIKTTLLSIVETDMIDSEDKDGDNISRDAAEQILKLLDKSESELPLEKKLKTISTILLRNNAEIWVLIDEFQQVVEKWSITQSVLFKDLCKQLKDSIENIRYVLCGADELVKLMINRDPVMVMYKDKTRAIGQFTERDKNDFFDMLGDPMIWGNAGHPFTKEALDYIFTYTGGNAMYGKLIGNRVIDAIESGEFSNRRKIYPYDVSSVVAKMLSEQKSDIHATSAVNEFIANVTKNLDNENPYLSYIASLMMKEPDRTSVSSSEIYDYFGATASQDLRIEIDTALLLCSVRGILNSSEESGESLYSFSTTFYYSQYCEIVKRSGVPNRIIPFSDENKEELESKKRSIEALESELRERTYDEIEELRSRLPSMFKGSETRVIHTDKYVEGDDKSSQVQVNIQTMANTFNQILSGVTGDQLLTSLSDLPRLDAYFDESGVPSLKELESDSAERVVEAEAKLESTTSQMVSDYLSALVSNNDTPNEFCVWDVLGITKGSYMDISRRIHPSFMADLFFAAKLDYIFKLAKSDESELDYSPVCIMYCKTLEKVLQFYHTGIYGDYFPDIECYFHKYKNTHYRFVDLKNMEHTARIEIQNKIMLGSFNYPIYPKQRDEDTEWINIPKSKRSDWRKHGKMLNNVIPIRNKSAHGNSNGNIVGNNLLEKLKRHLFSDDGILNIIGLSEED